MDVFAYLRHVGSMPANVSEILQSLHDAVTLKPVYVRISDWAVEAVDDAEDDLRSK